MKMITLGKTGITVPQNAFGALPVQRRNFDESAVIDADCRELDGEFCRGCGYCMPCPQGIKISNCARMSLMIRRSPSEEWLSDEWQQAMADAEKCVGCGECIKKCPYELNTPELLKKNFEDYKKILSGEITVNSKLLLFQPGL